MNAQVNVAIPRDGVMELHWQAASRARSCHVLVVRTGAVPAFTALQLDGDTQRYAFNNLSRHQRYRVAVLSHGKDGVLATPWVQVTPRAGLEPRVDAEAAAWQECVSRVSGVTLMPQDGRITAYWRKSPGFADSLALEVKQGDKLVKALELEPEVQSISLDTQRGCQLRNGQAYSVSLRTRFAGLRQEGPAPVSCIPAPAGQEREANTSLPQPNLVYPCLALSPEIRIFDDDPVTHANAEAPAHRLVCFHCRHTVEWRGYRLRCGGCSAEFIPTGRGDYLDVAQLRFGTCRCCLPPRILIQRKGSDALTCSHSGKEHIRLPESREFHLIEDLPFGLCQCCRPRRPLLKRGNDIVCSKSGEKHRNDQGRYVLVPSQPVFDAAAIDELLDAGLAEICATGISRARR